MRDIYIHEISLELNRNICDKLEPYFEGHVYMSKGVELPKLEIGKPKWLGFDYFFPARRPISGEERAQLNQLKVRRKEEVI